jgi:glycerol-3-phosphate O-acyltransferase
MTALVWFLSILGVIGAGVFVMWWLARQSRRAVLSWYGQASDRAVARFQAKVEPFKFARRTEVHERLMADPVVREAIEEHARSQGVSVDDTEREVSGYIREIVPFFNVLSYYRFGYAISRFFVSILYQVRIATRDTGAAEEIPENDVVVYLMNHRSNADYVVVAFVLSGTVSISYAVGEWARTWPLEYLFKSFGSYFIRRRYRVPLYHTVLERYIQLITRNRVTQGIFPEGGLTRDGALRPPKLGLLDYLARTLADDDFQGDIWLVPVGINYDRVLEDRTLIQERIVGSRRRGRLRQFGSVVHYLTRNVLRLAFGRFQRYGEVAVAFGKPLSVRAWLGRQSDNVLVLPKAERLSHIERLAAEALAKVGDVVPVTPVPLASAALLSLRGSALTEPQVLDRMDELRDALQARGAMLANPHASIGELWQRAWRILRMRRLVVREGAMLVIMPRQRPLLEYYANSLSHLLPEEHRPVMTPAGETDPTLPRLARRDELSVETGSYTVGDAAGDKRDQAPPRRRPE